MVGTKMKHISYHFMIAHNNKYFHYLCVREGGAAGSSSEPTGFLYVLLLSTSFTYRKLYWVITMWVEMQRANVFELESKHQ